MRTATASAGAVDATVSASTVDDGSALVDSVAGLRPGETCRMVAVDRERRLVPGGHVAGVAAGRRHVAGLGRRRATTLCRRSCCYGDGGRELVQVQF